MNHSENEYILALDAIDDDVLAYGEAATPYTEILIAGAPGRREAGQKKKPVRDGVNQPGGNFYVATFLGDIKPDVV